MALLYINHNITISSLKIKFINKKLLYYTGEKKEVHSTKLKR